MNNSVHPPEFSAPPQNSSAGKMAPPSQTLSDRLRRIGDVMQALHEEFPPMANTIATAGSITKAIEDLELAVLRGISVKARRAQ